MVKYELFYLKKLSMPSFGQFANLLYVEENLYADENKYHVVILCKIIQNLIYCTVNI